MKSEKFKVKAKSLKLKKLKDSLKKMRSVVVAYSGGVDSTFLLKIALDILGRDKVLAVTACSETYPSSEYREAKKIAERLCARHLTIYTEELGIKNFKSNPINRCYYCKKELFKKLTEIKKELEFGSVLDGTNFDDLKDIRYGRKAAKELGVKSPLLEAEMTKTDIRRFSKSLKLPTWDKPSYACLASRFPFRTGITKEKLTKVDKAEAYLKRLGFKQIRVRMHGDIARLEFYPEDFKKILNAGIREDIIRQLKKLGFKYIALDIEGYRTGSMHSI